MASLAAFADVEPESSESPVTSSPIITTAAATARAAPAMYQGVRLCLWGSLTERGSIETDS